MFLVKYDHLYLGLKQCVFKICREGRNVVKSGRVILGATRPAEGTFCVI